LFFTAIPLMKFLIRQAALKLNFVHPHLDILAKSDIYDYCTCIQYLVARVSAVGN
jgi:hypothetical protein